MEDILGFVLQNLNLQNIYGSRRISLKKHERSRISLIFKRDIPKLGKENREIVGPRVAASIPVF